MMKNISDPDKFMLKNLVSSFKGITQTKSTLAGRLNKSKSMNEQDDCD